MVPTVRYEMFPTLQLVCVCVCFFFFFGCVRNYPDAERIGGKIQAAVYPKLPCLR